MGQQLQQSLIITQMCNTKGKDKNEDVQKVSEIYSERTKSWIFEYAHHWINVCKYFWIKASPGKMLEPTWDEHFHCWECDAKFDEHSYKLNARLPAPNLTDMQQACNTVLILRLNSEWRCLWVSSQQNHMADLMNRRIDECRWRATQVNHLVKQRIRHNVARLDFLIGLFRILTFLKYLQTFFRTFELLSPSWNDFWIFFRQRIQSD